MVGISRKKVTTGAKRPQQSFITTWDDKIDEICASVFHKEENGIEEYWAISRLGMVTHVFYGSSTGSSYDYSRFTHSSIADAELFVSSTVTERRSFGFDFVETQHLNKSHLKT